jgi:hypothetical protein
MEEEEGLSEKTTEETKSNTNLFSRFEDSLFETCFHISGEQLKHRAN